MPKWKKLTMPTRKKQKFGDNTLAMNAIGRGQKDIKRNARGKQTMRAAGPSNLPKKRASKPVGPLAKIRR